MELVQSELNNLQQRQESLMRIPRIKKYLGVVDEHVRATQDRGMTLYEKRNVAQCLYNAVIDTGLKAGTRLFEATTEDNISFLGVQLPVIAALLPSLALNEIAVVQAMDRRIAAVFYLDVKYGSTKGAVTAGDTMMSATTGHTESKTGRRYAMARVVGEALTNSGSAITTGTVSYAPGLINLENVAIYDGDGTQVGECDSEGTITEYVSGAGVTGTITAAGVYSIDFTNTTAGSGEGTATITYDYQYDLPVDSDNNRIGVPEADVSVRQETVEAIDFPLRAKYSVGAQIDLMKAHGINLEAELVKYLGGEVKFTIDQVGLDMIDTAAGSDDAAAGITTWDARMSQGEPWMWKKEELLDRFEEGSNNIFDKTKRGVATFIHCGNNIARVLRQLDKFKPRGGGTNIPTGPMVIGTIDGRTVVQNPFKSSNYYTMGFRGPSYLYAGFIYCPYIPLFTTPTLITSDLMAQKGFLSSAGFKVVNAGLFCEGQISNLGGGYISAATSV